MLKPILQSAITTVRVLDNFTDMATYRVMLAKVCLVLCFFIETCCRRAWCRERSGFLGDTRCFGQRFVGVAIGTNHLRFGQQQFWEWPTLNICCGGRLE